MGSDKSVGKNSKRKLEPTKVFNGFESCEFEPVLSDVELVWRGKRQLEKQEVADLRTIETRPHLS